MGGMPEAVAAYSATRHFADVTPVHQSIVDTYQDDFAKYASARVRLRLQRVFNYVPRAVGRKVKYTQIDREETARELRVAIDLLAKARVIAPVFHSACSGVPLHAEVDWKTYKLLFLDIGLMNRLCGLDWLALKDLDDRRLINEGALAEQFVGQHLLYLAEGRETPRLNYWLREGKSANAEVDYAIARGCLDRAGRSQSRHQRHPALTASVRLGQRDAPRSALRPQPTHCPAHPAPSERNAAARGNDLALAAALLGGTTGPPAGPTQAGVARVRWPVVPYGVRAAHQLSWSRAIVPTSAYSVAYGCGRCAPAGQPRKSALAVGRRRTTTPAVHEWNGAATFALGLAAVTGQGI